MPIRHKPSLTYSGLTIVLSNPSRFDLKSGGLLSANGGIFFDRCLDPEFNRFQCDIRVKEDKTPRLEGTKCVLLLGEDAMNDWLGEQARGNTLGELRGTVFDLKGVPCVCSYLPQDCVDIKDHESEHNPLHKHEGLGEMVAEGDDKRRHGKTQRKNYGFWFDRDLQRAKQIIKYGIPKRTTHEPKYTIYPSSSAIIEELTNTKGQYLYLDFETDSNFNPWCLGYSFGLPTISVFPFIDFNYQHAYTNLCNIVRALAIACRDNTVVAHSGSNFDFRVLAIKLRIAIRKCYDTLIAHHRCWPDVEKSLGHGMSHLTWEPFHKDEAAGWNTRDQMTKTMEYCGKDIYGMILMHQSITKHAKSVPGLPESIEQAMASIRPYLITSLLGIQYEQKLVTDPRTGEKVWDLIYENDRLMKEYLRIINLLIGPKTVAALRAKSIKAMPASNSQACYYFHELLGYEPVAYGKETKKGTFNPSLAKGAIFKLRQKYANPVLDLVIAYREIAKETGSLGFTPWSGIPNTKKYERQNDKLVTG